MNKRTIITALIAMFAILTAKAQLTDWQNISSKNFVTKIIHDENYLYVGTKGGGIVKIHKQSGEQTVLKRDDGSMTGNSITDMALHNGELWVGTEFNGIEKVTDGGIEKFDKKNAGFRINQHFSGFFFKDDGTMLVGSIAYLYAFDGKKCTDAYDINVLSLYTYVKKIRADRDGRIWVACYDALNKYNLCVSTPNDLVPYNILYGRVNNIETDKDGCLWIATNKGLVKFDGNDFTHCTPDISVLPEANIIDLTFDEKGNLWMMGEHSITKYDGTNFTAYPYQLGDKNDYLLTIDADNEDVYVGSRFKGLLKLTNNGLEAITLRDNQLYDSGLKYSTGCLDRNGIFYGATTNGLQTYNIETDECHFEPMGQIVQTEADLSGNVWLRWPWSSTDTCLVEISATGKKAYMRTDYPFTEANANFIKLDRKNRLWIAMNKGLYMRDGETWTVFNKSNSSLTETIQCMAFDSDNRLWCGTFGSGLFLFDGSKWTQYTTSNSQIPSNYVGFVAVDNDNVLWLNCRDPQYPDKMGSEFGLGLTRFDGNTWTTYNCNNSPLPSNCFWDVQVDADNRKWIATAGDLGVVGLVCFDGSGWTIYNTSNSGIVLNEVTKITLDSKRDLIWLTHHPGLGLSVARLNSHNTAVQSIAAPNTTNTTIYDLSGKRVTNPMKGIYIKQGKKFVKE